MVAVIWVLAFVASPDRARRIFRPRLMTTLRFSPIAALPLSVQCPAESSWPVPESPSASRLFFSPVFLAQAFAIRDRRTGRPFRTAGIVHSQALFHKKKNKKIIENTNQQ